MQNATATLKHAHLKRYLPSPSVRRHFSVLPSLTTSSVLCYSRTYCCVSGNTKNGPRQEHRRNCDGTLRLQQSKQFHCPSTRFRDESKIYDTRLHDSAHSTNVNRSPRRATTPSRGSCGSVWRNQTRQMLEGALPLHSLMDVMSWWTNQTTTEAATITWQLLDLLTTRQEVPNDGRHTLTLQKTCLFTKVLDHWRICSRTSGVKIPFDCFQMWDRMKQRSDLTTRMYSIFLSSLSRNDRKATVLATEVLDHAIVFGKITDVPTQNRIADRESTFVWNSGLAAFTKTHAGGLRTEELFRRMSGLADERSYASVLQAWADDKVVSDSPLHAERLLQEMVETLGPGARSDPTKLDSRASVCYLQVLRAWASSKDQPDATVKARSILNGLISEFKNGGTDIAYYPHVKPTQRCFGVVMSAYARQGQPDEVEALMKELQQLYTETNDIDFLPTTPTFNAILQGFALKASPTAAQKAQDLLERLDSMSAASAEPALRNCRPNEISVNICISAWAASGAKDAFQRAQALLHWPGTRPSTYGYTAVLKALAYSKHANAAEESKRILSQMWNACNDDPHGPKPNVVTYSTILYCLARTQHIDAPIHAERVYRDLLSRQASNTSLQPDLSIYTMMVLVWAFSDRPEGSLRAQAYFDQVRGKCLAGDERFRPDQKIYDALLASKKHAKDGAGAEAVLALMQSDFDRGVTKAKPDRRAFHAVLGVWANSNDSMAYERMRDLIVHMTAQCEENKLNTEPNKATFKILLNYLAKYNSASSVTCAEGVLRHMQDLSDTGKVDCKPCGDIYGMLVKGWAAAVDTPDKAKRALRVYKTMLEQGGSGHEPVLRGSVYTILLTIMAQATDTNMAMEGHRILIYMEKQHIRDPIRSKAPTLIHYTCIVSAFAKHGDAVNAEQTFQRMLDRKILPSKSACHSLMEAYSKANVGPQAVEKAQDLLESMVQKYNLTPHALTYTAFLQCLGNNCVPDPFSSAKLVLEDVMRRRMEGEVNVFLNATFFTKLLAILEKHGAHDSTLLNRNEIEYIAQSMKTLEIPEQAQVWHELRRFQERLCISINETDGCRS